MKVKVAYLFVFGGCWHEFQGEDRKCIHCRKSYSNIRTILAIRKYPVQKDANLNPDPLHDDGDYWRLVKGMMSDREKWWRFEAWGLDKKIDEEIRDIDFTPWLFLDPARFIDLIWQFTGLKEVQDNWGWVDANCPIPCSECVGRRGEIACNGSGKVPAPWLTARKEAK